MTGTKIRSLTWFRYAPSMLLNQTVQDKPWSKKFNQMYARNDIKNLATEQTAKGSKHHISLFSSQLNIEGTEYSNPS